MSSKSPKIDDLEARIDSLSKCRIQDFEKRLEDNPPDFLGAAKEIQKEASFKSFDKNDNITVIPPKNKIIPGKTIKIIKTTDEQFDLLVKLTRAKTDASHEKILADILRNTSQSGGGLLGFFGSYMNGVYLLAQYTITPILTFSITSGIVIVVGLGTIYAFSRLVNYISFQVNTYFEDCFMKFIKLVYENGLIDRKYVDGWLHENKKESIKKKFEVIQRNK